MDMNSFQIRFYDDGDWNKVKSFIKLNWRFDHPFSKKRLFDWQFRGFGNYDNNISSLILFQDDEVIGFRGIIPGLYQVPSLKTGMSIILGGSLAMWMVREDFRRKGLGLMMHQEAQKILTVITGSGSDPKTSVPIYLKNGFSLLDSMNRYVIPLDVSGYHRLLSRKVEVRYVREWSQMLSKNGQIVNPSEVNPDSVAAVWEKTTFQLHIFSLYRNVEFWKWRYLDSCGFTYIFFGDVNKTGLIVARIEKIGSKEHKDLNGLKVFRIIEIIPRNLLAWNGGNDICLVELIQGVLRWALKQGCLAADFYCSTTRFERMMKGIGFKRQEFNKSAPICSLAMLFQPLKYVAQPINALFRIDTDRKDLLIKDFEDTYMVKSDNDMDRPNSYNL